VADVGEYGATMLSEEEHAELTREEKAKLGIAGQRADTVNARAGKLRKKPPAPLVLRDLATRLDAAASDCRMNSYEIEYRVPQPAYFSIEEMRDYAKELHRAAEFIEFEAEPASSSR
jgi:hypothetical protein